MFVGHRAESAAIVLLDNEDAVRAVAPDFQALKAFQDLVIVTAPGDEQDVASRVFAVPWQERLLVGTTDDELTIQTRMVVEKEEADYLLRQLNPYLNNPLRLQDALSGMAGLRPLG